MLWIECLIDLSIFTVCVLHSLLSHLEAFTIFIKLPALLSKFVIVMMVGTQVFGVDVHYFAQPSLLYCIFKIIVFSIIVFRPVFVFRIFKFVRIKVIAVVIGIIIKFYVFKLLVQVILSSSWACYLSFVIYRRSSRNIATYASILCLVLSSFYYCACKLWICWLWKLKVEVWFANSLTHHLLVHCSYLKVYWTDWPLANVKCFTSHGSLVVYLKRRRAITHVHSELIWLWCINLPRHHKLTRIHAPIVVHHELWACCWVAILWKCKLVGASTSIIDHKLTAPIRSIIHHKLVGPTRSVVNCELLRSTSPIIDHKLIRARTHSSIYFISLETFVTFRSSFTLVSTHRDILWLL